MKRLFYILCGAVLGFLISVIIHAIIEYIILWWSGYSNTVIIWTQLSDQNYCVLPFRLIITLPILGIIGGVILGNYFYNKKNKNEN